MYLQNSILFFIHFEIFYLGTDFTKEFCNIKKNRLLLLPIVLHQNWQLY